MARRCDFLGWWDLSLDNPVPEHPSQAEAGWRLARRHWRRGYATEEAAKLLNYGCATVGLGGVWAETMAGNEPSRRVMRKLGMHHVRTDHPEWDDPLPAANKEKSSTRSLAASGPALPDRTAYGDGPGSANLPGSLVTVGVPYVAVPDRRPAMDRLADRLSDSKSQVEDEP